MKNSKKIGAGLQAGIKKLKDISASSGRLGSNHAKARILPISVEIVQADVEIVQTDADDMDIDEDEDDMAIDLTPQSLMDAMSSEKKVH